MLYFLQVLHCASASIKVVNNVSNEGELAPEVLSITELLEKLLSDFPPPKERPSIFGNSHIGPFTLKRGIVPFPGDLRHQDARKQNVQEHRKILPGEQESNSCAAAKLTFGKRKSRKNEDCVVESSFENLPQK